MMTTTTYKPIVTTFDENEFFKTTVKSKRTTTIPVMRRTTTEDEATSTTEETTFKDSVFIVTPEATTEDMTETFEREMIKTVTSTPGVATTTEIEEDENDVETMSSQHVQKVTKAPANIPDNFLTSVVRITCCFEIFGRGYLGVNYTDLETVDQDMKKF